MNTPLKAKNRTRSKKVSLAGLTSSLPVRAAGTQTGIFGVSNGIYLRNCHGKYSANYVVAGVVSEQTMNNSADDRSNPDPRRVTTR